MSQKRFTEYFKKTNAVGAIAAIFNNRFEIIERYNYGYRDIANQLPIDQDTKFGIASMTKSMTCLAIMQLVEKGIVSPKDSVAKYLPDFDLDDGITLQSLMTHSSGFFPQHRTTIMEIHDQHPIDFQQEFAYDANLAEIGRKAVIDQLRNDPYRTGNPSAILSYSNDGYGLLSEIVRLHSSFNSYGEYLDQCIFKPLRMDRSSIEFINHIDDNTTKLYSVAKSERSEHTFYDNAFILNGGGSVKSTLHNLIHYVQIYLNQGKESVISHASIQEMTFPHIFAKPGIDYGYGLSIELVNSTKLIGHGGSLPGVSSSMLWNVEGGIGIVVLCNTTDIDVSTIARSLLLSQLDIKESKKDPVYQQWTFSRQEAVVGTYGSAEDPDTVITIASDGKATIQDEHYRIATLVNQQIVLINDQREQVLSLIQSNSNIIGLKYGYRAFRKIK